MEDKAQWRRRLKAVRASLPEAERGVYSDRIAEQVLELPAVRDLTPSQSTIALYASIGTEVRTRPLFAAWLAAGFRVVYPRVCPHRRMLDFVAVEDLHTMHPGTLGISEPEGAPLAMDEIDLLVAPGLGFDAKGGRLGYGRGYYDSVLGRGDFRGVTVGLAFACQMVSEVPMLPHDRYMHWVVTEQKVYRGGAAAA